MIAPILIIVHSFHYEDRLEACLNYCEVAAYFLNKHLKANNIHTHVIAGEQWMGTKQKFKSTLESFESHFDKNLLQVYHHVIFVGACPLKQTHPKIIEWFNHNVKGKFIEIAEMKRGAKGHFQFFALPDTENESDKFIGPMYDSDSLYPDKQYTKLVLQIDHHMEGRGDCHQQIIEKIQELPSNQIFQKHWNGYELYYHGQKLNSISDFDYYNRPPNIPFAELSALYRRTHIGFLSHRETLGLYPVEMAACGTVVALLGKPRFLQRSMHKIVSVELNGDDFWDRVLPKVTPEYAKQVSGNIAFCSYENGVSKILEHL